jgi:hypothetical protein
LCEFINTLAVGTQYTVKEAREYITLRAKELNFDPTALQVSTMAASTQQGLSYIIGCNHVRILTTKCIRRVKRGVYEVVAHIPDWVTVGTTDANRGYRKWTSKFVDGKWTEGQLVPRGTPWRLGDPEPEKTKRVSKPRVNKAQQEMDRLVKDLQTSNLFVCSIINHRLSKLKENRVTSPIVVSKHPDLKDIIVLVFIANKALQFTYFKGETPKADHEYVFKLEEHLFDENYMPINGNLYNRFTDIKNLIIESTIKPKLMVLGQLEGLLKTKAFDEVVIATAEGLGPVKVFEIGSDLVGVYDKSNVVEYVEVGKLIGIQKVKSEHWLAIMSHEFDARGIQTDTYKLGTHLAFFKGTDVPAREHSVIVAEQVKMKEQIVSILKEGLSAADAADKIIKLFNK